jgi:hypothetical protein
MRLRRLLFGLLAMLAAASVSSAALADRGTVYLSIFKAGWFVGGAGGSGTLIFHGKRYPLSIGGLSAGLIFGAAHAKLSGWVENIRRPSDIGGVYAAAGAGAAVGVGGGGMVLTNGNGAHLHLSGGQVGLLLNASLSGMSISVR